MKTPAIKKEINLFTSSKNIDQEKLAEIQQALAEAKKIDNRLSKIRIPLNFIGSFECQVHDINLDTFMYAVDFYGFQKPRMIGGASAFYVTELFLNRLQISLFSKDFKINLLSNDVKQTMHL